MLSVVDHSPANLPANTATHQNAKPTEYRLIHLISANEICMSQLPPSFVLAHQWSPLRDPQICICPHLA